MNKEHENRFLILYSISMQNGKATKKQVLDFLENNDLIKLSVKDKELLSSRKEERWRNELAFVRQHLVENNLLDNKERNYWSITENGENFLSDFGRYMESASIRISETMKSIFIDTRSNCLLKSNFANELFEDNKELQNETVERQIIAIKRYKKIVENLKQKYSNKCQLSNCGNTFKKKNNEFYSEAHHLIPLSQGGT